MALISFTRNYSDRSNDTGFQFEFYCDKCHSGHMSRFQPSAIGIGAKLLRAAGWVFGNYWSWGYAGDSVKDVFRGRAWDKAYETAVGEAKQHFRSCTRCGHWVCPRSAGTRAPACVPPAPLTCAARPSPSRRRWPGNSFMTRPGTPTRRPAST